MQYEKTKKPSLYCFELFFKEISLCYTHLKIVFGKNPKTILPEYNSNQDLVFWKAKNQTGFSILLYRKSFDLMMEY